MLTEINNQLVRRHYNCLHLFNYVVITFERIIYVAIFVILEIYFLTYKIITFYSVIYTLDEFCDTQGISNVLSIGWSRVSSRIQYFHWAWHTHTLGVCECVNDIEIWNNHDYILMYLYVWLFDLIYSIFNWSSLPILLI